ncbi:MAG: helix-turn-helix domain-containing protein [Cyanobacteria bacterium REEB67]|nr:helix-turn-helix domain-containing protein [Cyanobacteria bacterium REEB67]
MSFAPDYDDLYACLGRVIIQRRKKIDMTQTELATKSGVDRSFISDLERGKRHPSFGTVNKIATGLNMRYSRLVKQCEIYLQEAKESGAANLQNMTNMSPTSEEIA